MWLEFMKGDPKNILDRTLLKQRYSDLFPNPKQFVCVHLTFTNLKPHNFEKHLMAAFNKALEAAGRPRLSFENTMPFHSFIASLGDKQAAFFIDEYDAFARDYPDELLTTQQFFAGIKDNPLSIPYCYVTGSSRLDLSSGGNFITKLGV